MSSFPPERTSTKREAEQLAAGQALGHLEGLLRANRRPLPGKRPSVAAFLFFSFFALKEKGKKCEERACSHETSIRNRSPSL